VTRVDAVLQRVVTYFDTRKSTRKKNDSVVEFAARSFTGMTTGSGMNDSTVAAACVLRCDLEPGWTVGRKSGDSLK
jgi:hypothetical protein